jgi:WD40 repeat protein
MTEDVSAPYYFAADQSVVWCKDGQLRVQAKDGTVSTFDVPSQKRCSGAALSPQKTYAAVWGKNYLTLVNLATGQPQDLVGLQRDMNSVGFSADESILVSGSLAPQWNTSEVVFWQTEPPKSLNFPERLDDRDILKIVVSQDETFAVTLGGRIRVWQIKDGINLVIIDSYSYSLALSPNDRLIASGDYDGNVHLWSVADGSELAVLKGNQNQVIDIAFTPDGSGIITLSLDGAVRLWGLP